MSLFDCGFSTIVQTGLISKSYKIGMESFLNYEPSLKTTLRGLG